MNKDTRKYMHARTHARAYARTHVKDFCVALRAIRPSFNKASEVDVRRPALGTQLVSDSGSYRDTKKVLRTEKEQRKGGWSPGSDQRESRESNERTGAVQFCAIMWTNSKG